jgi:hypothetical protein
VTTLPQQTYRLHDLQLETPLPLAPSPLSAAPADVVISYAETPGPAADPSTIFSTTWRGTPEGGTLSYQGSAGDRLDFFLHDAGARVDIRCTVPHSAEAVARIFLGPGMAALLSLRGAVVLHGGAVVVDDRAILILGDSGAGKSTLVAAMAAAGAPFLTEEVAALVEHLPEASGSRGLKTPHGLQVVPGYPRIGLSGGSIAAVASPADRPLVLPNLGEDKRWLDVSELEGGPHRLARPVGAVYVLRERTGRGLSSIARLPASSAAATVLQHLYGARWLTPDHGRCLRAVAALAAEVPVFHLALPAGLDRIGAAAAAVIAHARAHIAA